MLAAQGNLPEALKSFRDSSGDCRAAGESRPRQCGLAARSVGVVREGRRRAGGAGQPARGAEIVPRPARDQRADWRVAPTPTTPAGSAICRCRYDQRRRRADGAGQSARGAEILTATGWRSATGWRRRTPATPAGSAICRCRYDKVGDVLVAQGNLPEALKSYRDSLAIADRLAKARPRQRRLAARSVGVVQQGWRRAGGAGQPARGAEILPRQPGDQRPAGESRPRQRRLAARSVGVVREGRRRADGAGQPARGAEILPRQPGD